MTDTPTPHQVLALPMPENDANVATVRDYLIALLATLWDEKDGFDGKRPFGNSDWDGHLVIALIRGGLIDGALDEDGYIERCDDDAAEELIAAAIQSLGTELDRLKAVEAEYLARIAHFASLDDDLDGMDGDPC